MSLRALAITVISILLLGACGRSRHSSLDVPDPDSYDEPKAMSYLISDPEYALQLLDSAYYQNNISDLRHQYLRAVVLYTGMDYPDSSMLICRHLVESEAWSEVTDTAFIVDVFRLMATIAGTLDRPADVVHYAQLGSDYAHGNPEFLSDEYDLLSRVGRTMAVLGQPEDGLALMERALKEMDNSKSWINFMTYVNICRKVAVTQLEMNHAEEALRTIYGLLHKLEYFEAHALEFDDLQLSMRQNPKAIKDYVNFNRVRCYANMVSSFAALNVPDSAFYWMEVMDGYKESHSPYIIIGLIPSLVKLHYDEWVLENVDTLLVTMGADTLDMEYVRLLEAMSELEQHNDNWKQSSNYLTRAMSVRDSVEQLIIRNQLSDQMTIYQLQDERYSRMDAEARNRRLIFVSASLSLFLVLMTVIGFSMRISRNLKMLRRVHVTTETELQEAKQQIKELSKRYVAETPQHLYKRIMRVMETRKPYMDQDFDIYELAIMVNSNRTYISKVINMISGMNFRNWLANYRINLAKQYMMDNPQASMDEICMISGYSSRTSLFRHFKQLTGYTPIAWMNIEMDKIKVEKEQKEENMSDDSIKEDSVEVESTDEESMDDESLDDDFMDGDSTEDDSTDGNPIENNSSKGDSIGKGSR